MYLKYFLRVVIWKSFVVKIVGEEINLLGYSDWYCKEGIGLA